MFCIQTHTFYIYSRVSFQAWLPLYSTICSPDRRCRHPADFKLHHTYTVYIEAKPRGICIKRVYPIFQDTFLSLGTCPSPVSMVRPPSSSSRCPQCVPPLTLDWSQWDWWILWTHDGPPPAYAHTSQVPHQTARMSPPQQQWRRLPNN